MSGGLETICMPNSGLMSPTYGDEGSSSTIHAPTPVFKLARFDFASRLAENESDEEDEQDTTTGSGSEIQSILAEKGTIGDSVIRSIPKIKSSDDCSRMVKDYGDFCGSASPLQMRTHMSSPWSGMDDLTPAVFPVRIKSYVDLSSFDNQDDDSYSSEGDIEPPKRCSNPVISHLDVKASSTRIAYGAELRLNTLSPAFSTYRS
eukprot:TRINITY_DN1793_c0_g1_i1.p1 TRINITY_DN1793_c0_g1~~TRINITY_DN1793_c0_g1_i1.p1  ORF type:complete len:204 (+),score=28.28 TRINITY_DN1793_c0_g1_i1:204-815(+)